MIYPSINDLTRGKYNRYTLVIATAKCARLVTDEYIKQREIAEKLIANKETDKSLVSMIKKEYRDEKAVKTAINKFYSKDYHIVDSSISPIINFTPRDRKAYVSDDFSPSGAPEADKIPDKETADERTERE